MRTCNEGICGAEKKKPRFICIAPQFILFLVWQMIWTLYFLDKTGEYQIEREKKKDNWDCLAMIAKAYPSVPSIQICWCTGDICRYECLVVYWELKPKAPACYADHFRIMPALSGAVLTTPDIATKIHGNLLYFLFKVLMSRFVNIRWMIFFTGFYILKVRKVWQRFIIYLAWKKLDVDTVQRQIDA